MFKVGEPALPQLNVVARTHSDVEVRPRATNVIDRITVSLGHCRSLLVKFAYVKTGDFRMGSDVNEKDRRDNESQHTVRIAITLSSRLIGLDQPVAKPLVVSLAVIVLGVRSESLAQSGLTEEDHSAQTFALQGAKESFHV